MKNESTAYFWQCEPTCHEEREGRRIPRIIFYIFFRSSNMCVFASFVFIAFLELSLKWRPRSSTVFTSSRLVFNWLSLPRHVRPSTNSLPVFSPVSTAYQNLLLIQCWHVSIFKPGIPNYFTIVLVRFPSIGLSLHILLILDKILDIYVIICWKLLKIYTKTIPKKVSMTI